MTLYDCDGYLWAGEGEAPMTCDRCVPVTPSDYRTVARAEYVRAVAEALDRLMDRVQEAAAV